MSKPIVFISYSHDSAAHRERVLGLSERLRKDGIDTRLDQYVDGTPPEKWPRWMLDRLDEADFVLVVCTETYYRRFRGHEEEGKGKGADWEGAMILQEIYDARSRTRKFVPVLFSPEEERCIPEPLRGHTFYTLTSPASYEALYEFLLARAGAEPGPLGELRGRAAGPRRIEPSRLRHGAATLFGREEELAALDQAWDDPATHVLSIVAWGGVGKTALVATWAARLAGRGYDGACYLDWSFYSQGTRDQTSASSDSFIARALEFFGDPDLAASPASPWDKGARIAQLAAEQRTLLVLDGLEPLQYPPGPMAGELRDPAMSALLRGLAQRNPGLCVVNTREQVTDLAAFRGTTAPEWKLEHLSVAAGGGLLVSLGVRGTAAEIEQLVSDVGGHALTLNLMGGFLARAHGGDIRRRDRVQFAKADAHVQGGHAFKAMAAYERWLENGGEEGARQLAILRLLGLFDRPATAGCLAALGRAPPIPGLTEAVVGLDEEDWSLAAASLADCGLVSRGEAEVPGEPASLDTHPLIREYFAARLRGQQPDAWLAAHSRLFEYLRDIAEPLPGTRVGLQPLYQAVAHGCLAGRHQEACDDVFFARILRKGGFSTYRLGAIGADVSAIACFFEKTWSRVSASLSEPARAWLLGEAGFRLRALGRLAEALETMRAARQVHVQLGEWMNAGRNSFTVSQLELMLGEPGAVEAAVADAGQGVAYADRTGDVGEKMSKRAALADALHHAGRRDEALALFREAAAMDAESPSAYHQLYAVQVFLLCDLLLADAERAAWRVVLAPDGAPAWAELPATPSLLADCRDVSGRAREALERAAEKDLPFDIALAHLTLARAALCEALLRAPGSLPDGEARMHAGAAVDGLRGAGRTDYLPRGLLMRAWVEAAEGAADAARADLEDAWQLAERGPMRLYMADIHLYRARLFRGAGPYPWTSPRDDLAAARSLIERSGSRRRGGELEDAEAAVPDG